MCLSDYNSFISLLIDVADFYIEEQSFLEF